ncbi:MAG: type II toxin-antitoxin system PemK/MazF family toxin [Akkermansiaceae bacterium]|nr:type II toxin-antitoxin system PemK/MazF family toxin [Akkermansiaceae bacterium]
MNPGDTILARLQQADGQIKRRPALILTKMPPYNDLLICGISSQIRQAVEGFDEVISESDPDFGKSGLKATSLFRIGMVTTIPRTATLGALGSIPRDRLNRLLHNLSEHIKTEQASFRK